MRESSLIEQMFAYPKDSLVPLMFVGEDRINFMIRTLFTMLNWLALCTGSLYVHRYNQCIYLLDFRYYCLPLPNHFVLTLDHDEPSQPTAPASSATLQLAAMPECTYCFGDTVSSKPSLGLPGVREQLCNGCRRRGPLSVSTNLKSISVGHLPFRERRQPGRNKGSLCVPNAPSPLGDISKGSLIFLLFRL